MDMKTLETCSTIQEARIKQGMLEANGIPVMISDHNNLYVPVFGGIELLVSEQNYARARQLLDEHHE